MAVAPTASMEGPMNPQSKAASAEVRYTRFERARILGARALQISLGAPILIDAPPTLVDPVEIAELEFAADLIPITVRRGPAA
ncbi:MAG: DNA-directed RNA polymerase subunit K [Thermoplasmata archaeon]